MQGAALAIPHSPRQLVIGVDRKFLQTIITRVDANDEIYKKILDDEDFRATIGEFYLRKVYERLREGLLPSGNTPTKASNP